jgi:hypothetical protein
MGYGSTGFANMQSPAEGRRHVGPASCSLRSVGTGDVAFHDGPRISLPLLVRGAAPAAAGAGGGVSGGRAWSTRGA